MVGADEALNKDNKDSCILTIAVVAGGELPLEHSGPSVERYCIYFRIFRRVLVFGIKSSAVLTKLTRPATSSPWLKGRENLSNYCRARTGRIDSEQGEMREDDAELF